MSPPDAGAASELPFESGLARLEEIVGALEDGDLALERSLELFAEGTRLARALNQTLTGAERQIELLLGEPGDGGEGRVETGPFRGPGPGAERE